MSGEINPCRGCVCYLCSISEQNGAVNVCRDCRCNLCDDPDVEVVKLAYCENAELPDDSDDGDEIGRI